MSCDRSASIHPERALLHPVWLGALLLLVVNDHVLKGAGVLPAAVTGKLSDVAGLIVAPVLLAALIRARGRRSLGASFAAVAVVFAAINLVPSAARACEQLTAALGFGWRVSCDPSDLLALPALLLAWRLATSSTAAPRLRLSRTFAERLATMAGAVACMATSYAAPPPAVSVNGHVVTQGWGRGPVYVIDAVTGLRVTRVGAAQWGGVVTEVDGVLYLTSPRGVRGVAIDSGEQVMEYTSDGARFHPVLLVDDERIFLMTAPPPGHAQERIVAVERATGKELWSAVMPSAESRRGTSASPVIAGGLIVAVAGNDMLALERHSGRRLWRYRAEAPLLWPVWTGGTVYAAGQDGTIHAVDLVHGQLQWRHRAGKSAFEDTRWTGGARLGAGGGVVAFVRGGRLMGIDATTRAPRWSGPKVHDAVVGRSAAVVRLSEDDAVFGAVDLRDGQVRWRTEIDETVVADPILAEDDGLVVILPQSGELHAYELGTGVLRWKFDLDDGERVVDVGGGRLMVTRQAM